MLSNSKKYKFFQIAREAMARGENIVEQLTKKDGADRRTAIEIAYSLQSGSYTSYAKTETAIATRQEGHDILERYLAETGAQTVLDCGAGEGTRWFDFSYPLKELTLLDASFHRLLYAKSNLKKVPSVAHATCIKGDMLHLPLADGCFDVVFTSHAVEPNTDEDTRQIIANLFSVARRAVIMFEPNYRDADPEMRARMEKHGYSRIIWDEAHAQPGFQCVSEGKFDVSPNPSNQTSYMVFVREEAIPDLPISYVSPVSRSPLTSYDAVHLDEERCFGFPIISGISCLAEEDAVFLDHAPDVPTR